MRAIGLVRCSDCLLRKVAQKRILTIPCTVLPQLATFDIVLGSLYVVVTVIEAFGVFAAVKVCLLLRQIDVSLLMCYLGHNTFGSALLPGVYSCPPLCLGCGKRPYRAALPVQGSPAINCNIPILNTNTGSIDRRMHQRAYRPRRSAR